MKFNLLLQTAIFVAIAVLVETQPLFEEKFNYGGQEIQRLKENIKDISRSMQRLHTVVSAVVSILRSMEVCPKGWTMYDNSCYKFFEDAMTMKDGKKFCSSVNGHLVEIETKWENDFIINQLQKNYFRIKGSGCWIGATDEKKEGQWTWITTGTNISFSDWADGEPNNEHNDEHCLEMRKDFLWHWNDILCTKQMSVLCEREKIELTD